MRNIPQRALQTFSLFLVLRLCCGFRHRPPVVATPGQCRPGFSCTLSPSHPPLAKFTVAYHSPASRFPRLTVTLSTPLIQFLHPPVSPAWPDKAFLFVVCFVNQYLKGKSYLMPIESPKHLTATILELGKWLCRFRIPNAHNKNEVHEIFPRNGNCY